MRPEAGACAFVRQKQRPKRPPKRSDFSLGLFAPSRVRPGARPAAAGGFLKREGREISTMGFKVAVVGATGNVGREMLNILEERGFPADEVVPLASRRSVGTEVSYGDRTLKVKGLDTYDFSDTDICVMSAGGNVSKEWSPKIGR